ncbi:hypothetical protein FB567DRAFT_152754 [Paraphoma chrysanthemicola]|uniref:Uncharacterized protein n=1 Tax=Paraphoma chrysanthemicola TaxID=798071 RepID=A0A8K0QWT1_9PLEO|nr:hypothetical protein FB567DRAFT_152754 [Paraphoma chrysanthemicola]
MRYYTRQKIMIKYPERVFVLAVFHQTSNACHQHIHISDLLHTHNPLILQIILIHNPHPPPPISLLLRPPLSLTLRLHLLRPLLISTLQILQPLLLHLRILNPIRPHRSKRDSDNLPEIPHPFTVFSLLVLMHVRPIGSFSTHIIIPISDMSRNNITKIMLRLLKRMCIAHDIQPIIRRFRILESNFPHFLNLLAYPINVYFVVAVIYVVFWDTVWHVEWTGVADLEPWFCRGG